MMHFSTSNLVGASVPDAAACDYLRAAAPAADPGVHVREGKQLQRHKLDIIGGDMLDLFQLDEGFEESYTEVV